MFLLHCFVDRWALIMAPPYKTVVHSQSHTTKKYIHHRIVTVSVVHVHMCIVWCIDAKLINMSEGWTRGSRLWFVFVFFCIFGCSYLSAPTTTVGHNNSEWAIAHSTTTLSGLLQLNLNSLMCACASIAIHALFIYCLCLELIAAVVVVVIVLGGFFLRFYSGMREKVRKTHHTLHNPWNGIVNSLILHKFVLSCVLFVLLLFVLIM